MILANWLSLSAPAAGTTVAVTMAAPFPDANALSVTFTVVAINGSGASVAFMIQTSSDAENWTDVTPGSAAFTVVGVTSATKAGISPVRWIRLKITLTAGGVDAASVVVGADVDEERL